ncbi:twin-arginine translocase TatA/TatE family subunit [Rhodocista pekingensis]|uniref:Sec-independent protein translocase protein TatA n=1 Tax=Rhodocista pekingensis TaxID=201185 RepID=A0ABW2KYD8_9PROT
MSLGIWEMTVILLVVLLIFGTGKLPAAMGDLAKGLKAFKRELGRSADSAPPPARREAE